MKKGFTLAELLGVIVIISLLLVLIVPNLINSITKSKEPAKATNNEIIYNAAEQYISEHSNKYPKGKSGTYCILIKDLIESGKLAYPVKDPTTGKDMSDKSVKVATYNEGNTRYEITEGSQCTPLSASEMLTFIVDPQSSDWVKQRKVTIVFPKMNETYKAKYRIKNCECHGTAKSKCEQTCDNVWKEVDIDSKNGGNVELTFDWSSKSSTLEAQYTDDKNVTILNAKVNVINIDVDAPKNFNISNPSNGNWTNKDVNLTLSADDEDSGVDYWYYKYTNTNFKKYSNSYGKSSYVANQTKEMNDQLYIKVCDKAGNCSEGNTYIKLDKTPPTKPVITNPTNGNWTYGDIVLTVSSSDKGSGLGYWYYKYANTDWISLENSYEQSPYKTSPYSAERNENTYIRVCDKAGNCSKASSTPIKIDKCWNTHNGSWSGCSASCGGGTQTQTYYGISGRTCGTRSQSCNTQSCVERRYTCRRGNTCINVGKNQYDCSRTYPYGTYVEVNWCDGTWCQLTNGYEYIVQRCTTTNFSECSASECRDI